MNVSEDTIKALYELNGKCFAMNRVWDATVSVLGVTYVCYNASKLIHEHIAHWYPHIADLINERCLENFNIVAYYPATPSGDVSFDNLQDMMEQMLDKTITFQNEFMAVRNIAMNHGDILVVVELDRILLMLNEQVAQMLLIKDKAEQYQSDYKGFDKDFETFFPIANSTTVRGV